MFVVADSIAYKFGAGRGGGVITLRLRDDERRDRRRDVIALGFSSRASDAVLLQVSSASSTDFLRIELVGCRAVSVERSPLAERAVYSASVENSVLGDRGGKG